jgi:hypothetical protein
VLEYVSKSNKRKDYDDNFRTPDEGHGIPAIYRILCRLCDEICEQFLEPIAQAVRLI